jgi:uncharacterized protein (DUF2141 family)
MHEGEIWETKFLSYSSRLIAMRSSLFCLISLVSLQVADLQRIQPAIANPTSNLVVNISGLRNQKGQLCLSLYASEKGFPSSPDAALQKQCVRIQQLATQVTFQGLAPGNYAIAVLHDANDDNKLNRNFLGIPTEGIGFSKNRKILSGAPKFQDASFPVAGPDTNIQIQLQYLLGS